MIQGSLLHDQPRRGRNGYRPPDLPNLSGERNLVVDCESSGLRWWGDDAPCGYAVGTMDGRSWYLPTRHAGGNLPEDKVVAWLRSAQGLAGKRVAAFKTTFDAHMCRVGGANLEEIGCTVTDVAHHAAILDDSRRELNLNSVARTYLTGSMADIQKLPLDLSGPGGARPYHASEVEEYARRDVELTVGSMLAMEPLIRDQGLDQVLALEDSCIFPTVEMERNGSLIDVAKLERWIAESQIDLTNTLYELYSLLGFRVEPGENKSLRRMFAHLSIPVPRVEYGDKEYEQGAPEEGQKETFGDPYLRKIQHPAVRLLRRAKKLASLRSKYLIPYMEDVRRNGVRVEGGFRYGRLRYALNQLRSDDGGTISGRYSSSALISSPREGVNIQQVAGKKQMSALKEIDPILLKYNVRELFVPAPGYRWFRADAKQIEYRLFAHYAKPPAIIAAYRGNPDIDYHNIVMEMIRSVLESITRERTKDLNFAMLFGAGVRKIAYMMGVSVKEAQRFVDAYLAAFPEAKRMRDAAMRTMQERGYVMTLLGRRARYMGRQMLNSALNRVIQGSAADINKRKIAEVHVEARRLGITMRFTVHDELNVDVPDEAAAAAIKEILNRQSFDTDVPILWDTKTGGNWAEAA